MFDVQFVEDIDQELEIQLLLAETKSSILTRE